jgi:two-component system cell cycle sensor histidine kinase/response regulator CckA
MTRVSKGILIVDDEELIRISMGKLLGKLGYSVFFAENGRIALDVYRLNKGLISLVILDMVMPEIDGFETFRKLKKFDPQVRVLLCSGYSKNERVDGALNHGACGFMEKPFDLKMLSTQVSNLVH